MLAVALERNPSTGLGLWGYAPPQGTSRLTGCREPVLTPRILGLSGTEAQNSLKLEGEQRKLGSSAVRPNVVEDCSENQFD